MWTGLELILASLFSYCLVGFFCCFLLGVLRFGLIFAFPAFPSEYICTYDFAPELTNRVGGECELYGSYGDFYYSAFTIVALAAGVLHMRAYGFLDVNSSSKTVTISSHSDQSKASSISTASSSLKSSGPLRQSQAEELPSVPLRWVKAIGGWRVVILWPPLVAIYIENRWGTNYAITTHQGWFYGNLTQSVIFMMIALIVLYHRKPYWMISRFLFFAIPVAALFVFLASGSHLHSILYPPQTDETKALPALHLVQEFFRTSLGGMMVQCFVAVVITLITTAEKYMVKRVIESGQSNFRSSHVLVLFAQVFAQLINIPFVAMRETEPALSLGSAAFFSAVVLYVQDYFSKLWSNSTTTAAGTLVLKKNSTYKGGGGAERKIFPVHSANKEQQRCSEIRTLSMTERISTTDSKVDSTVDSIVSLKAVSTNTVKERTTTASEVVGLLSLDNRRNSTLSTQLQDQIVFLAIASAAYSLGVAIGIFLQVRYSGITFLYGSCLDGSEILTASTTIYPLLSVSIIILAKIILCMWSKPHFLCFVRNQVQDRRILKELAWISIYWLPYLVGIIHNQLIWYNDESICRRTESAWWKNIRNVSDIALSQRGNVAP